MHTSCSNTSNNNECIECCVQSAILLSQKKRYGAKDDISYLYLSNARDPQTTFDAQNNNTITRDYEEPSSLRNISFTITKSPELYTSLTQCDADTVQLFLGSSHTYKRSIVKNDDLRRCERYVLDNGFRLYTHAPYVLSLGNPDLHNKSVASLKDELTTVSILRGYTVVHPNSGSIEDAINALDKIDFASIPGISINSLLLENSSREGNKLGRSLYELGKIIYGSINSKYIGICIDTAHMFAAGNYNMGVIDDINRFFRDVKHYIGIDKLRVVHLNDSKTEYNSHRDMHALIGNGCIWSSDRAVYDLQDNDNIDPLVYFIQQCTYYGIDIVTETGGGVKEMYNIRQTVSLHIRM